MPIRQARQPGRISYTDDRGEIHLNGSSLYRDGTTRGIIANPGGGQTNAVHLTSEFNKVTTVASAGDSVLLPPSRDGLQRFVVNAGANTCNVFPSHGDEINAAGANTAYALAAGHNAVFRCVDDRDWRAISGT